MIIIVYISYFLFFLCVCRCSPGWVGHRCESVANSEGTSGSGEHKSTLSIIDVSLIEHEDSPCGGLMFVCVCVCRHNLYSDPSAAAVAAGSSGCRSIVLVQKEDERVSDSNICKQETAETSFASVFPLSLPSFLSFLCTFPILFCNGILSAPQVWPARQNRLQAFAVTVARVTLFFHFSHSPLFHLLSLGCCAVFGLVVNVASLFQMLNGSCNSSRSYSVSPVQSPSSEQLRADLLKKMQ